MKCTYCNKKLDKVITKNFFEYNAGRIICPSCNKENKRYISELDLMIYFGLSCLVYSILIVLFTSLLNHRIDIKIIYLVIIGLVAIGAFLFTYISKYIYKNAPLKKSIKNKIFDENNVDISKRMKWQFILFMVVSYFFGTSSDTNFLYYYYFLLVAFNIIVAIKIYFLRKNELKK